jgi:hypothetical protein
MAKKRFSLRASVSTDSPASIRPILMDQVTHRTVTKGSSDNEFVVEAEMYGGSAKELNRFLLSALRKVEKKTRIRAEWSSGGTTERFFDYVWKGTRKSAA